MKNLLGKHIAESDVNNNLFESTFRSNFDSLFNYGMKIIKDENLVKDCIQELFFRIWKNNIDLTKVQFPKAYLITGLRRQIFNVIKLKENVIDKVELKDEMFQEFSSEDYLIQNQNEDENRKKVLKALNQLSDRQREAVYLRYIEELDYDEIAKIMSINLQSVKNNVQRGLDSLKEIMPASLYMYFFFRFISMNLNNMQ